MNKGFYKDLDTNFDKAILLADKEFLHEELIEFLKTGNIPEKQIAALRLDTVNNQEEADILVSNLTGCDGKIREAVALKINYILHNQKDLRNLFMHPEIFADATIDINANICRLVVDCVEILIKNEDFAKIYLQKVLKFIDSAFTELDNFIFRDKKYVINKQLFKLYWCLDVLRFFVDILPSQKLLEILERAVKESEYTIREKVAQILVLTQNDDFISLKNDLKNDENYYVREVFK